MELVDLPRTWLRVLLARLAEADLRALRAASADLCALTDELGAVGGPGTLLALPASSASGTARLDKLLRLCPHVARLAVPEPLEAGQAPWPPEGTQLPALRWLVLHCKLRRLLRAAPSASSVTLCLGSSWSPRHGSTRSQRRVTKALAALATCAPGLRELALTVPLAPASAAALGQLQQLSSLRLCIEAYPRLLYHHQQLLTSQDDPAAAPHLLTPALWAAGVARLTGLTSLRLALPLLSPVGPGADAAAGFDFTSLPRLRRLELRLLTDPDVSATLEAVGTGARAGCALLAQLAATPLAGLTQLSVAACDTADFWGAAEGPGQVLDRALASFSQHMTGLVKMELVLGRMLVNLSQLAPLSSCAHLRQLELPELVMGFSDASAWDNTAVRPSDEEKVAVAAALAAASQGPGPGQPRLPALLGGVHRGSQGASQVPAVQPQHQQAVVDGRAYCVPLLPQLRALRAQTLYWRLPVALLSPWLAELSYKRLRLVNGGSLVLPDVQDQLAQLEFDAAPPGLQLPLGLALQLHQVVGLVQALAQAINQLGPGAAAGAAAPVQAGVAALQAVLAAAHGHLQQLEGHGALAQAVGDGMAALQAAGGALAGAGGAAEAPADGGGGGGAAGGDAQGAAAPDAFQLQAAVQALQQAVAPLPQMAAGDVIGAEAGLQAGVAIGEQIGQQILQDMDEHMGAEIAAMWQEAEDLELGMWPGPGGEQPGAGGEPLGAGGEQPGPGDEQPGVGGGEPDVAPPPQEPDAGAPGPGGWLGAGGAEWPDMQHAVAALQAAVAGTQAVVAAAQQAAMELDAGHAPLPMMAEADPAGFVMPAPHAVSSGEGEPAVDTADQERRADAIAQLVAAGPAPAQLADALPGAPLPGDVLRGLVCLESLDVDVTGICRIMRTSSSQLSRVTSLKLHMLGEVKLPPGGLPPLPQLSRLEFYLPVDERNWDADYNDDEDRALWQHQHSVRHVVIRGTYHSGGFFAPGHLAWARRCMPRLQLLQFVSCNDLDTLRLQQVVDSGLCPLVELVEPEPAPPALGPRRSASPDSAGPLPERAAAEAAQAASSASGGADQAWDDGSQPLALPGKGEALGSDAGAGSSADEAGEPGLEAAEQEQPQALEQAEQADVGMHQPQWLPAGVAADAAWLLRREERLWAAALRRRRGLQLVARQANAAADATADSGGSGISSSSSSAAAARGACARVRVRLRFLPAWRRWSMDELPGPAMRLVD